MTTTDVAARQATVTLDTNESTTVTVRYGTACNGLTESQSGSGRASSHAVALSHLASATTYFYRVEATDAAGNLATDDNGGACYSFTTLNQPEFFTELFDAGDNDLGNQALTFTPDGSADFYHACRTPVDSFATDPAGGTPFFFGDDDYAQITLSGGAQVSLYGVSYSSFFVGSNGYITFGSADATYTESLDRHFQLPRIAALFDDLYPPTGGTISWKQLPDRVAVTFQNISEIGTSDSNNFQFELFFDGTIRITYLRIDATDGLAGLSQGLGMPPDFVESDLDVYGPCSCGNGALQAGEQCDDGNNANGDGCSASCHVEVCFQCAGEPSQCTHLRRHQL